MRRQDDDARGGSGMGGLALTSFTIPELAILVWLTSALVMVAYAASRGNDRASWLWVLGDVSAMAMLLVFWLRPEMPLLLSIAGTNLFGLMQPALHVAALFALFDAPLRHRNAVVLVVAVTIGNMILSQTGIDPAWRAVVMFLAIAALCLPTVGLFGFMSASTAAPMMLFLGATFVQLLVAFSQIAVALAAGDGPTQMTPVGQGLYFYLSSVVALAVNMAFLWLAVARQSDLHAEVQRRVAVELSAAKSMAEEALHAKSVFVASMRHAFRTPLNAVVGFNGLLAMDAGGRLSPMQREWTRYVDRSALHLLGIIDDILDLAGLDPVTIRRNSRTVRLLPLLEDAAASVRTEAEEAGVAVTVRCIATAAIAEPGRLAQAVTSLLRNAIGLCRPGDRIHLLAASSPNAGHIRIAVCDTGQGIPVERQPKLFEPFRHVTQSEADPHGSGLGLTLARKSVEAMGGSIDFVSWPGEGSSFWIDLPIPAETVGAEGTHASASVLFDEVRAPSADRADGTVPRGVRAAFASRAASMPDPIPG
jgi:signal transduction histidine kinase